MNTEFNYPQGKLTLHRWPLKQPNNSLQAWDAADELLLQHAFEAIEHYQQQHAALPSVLIINDSFGALSCALAHCRQVQINDSWLAQQATLYNRQQNALGNENLQQQSSIDAYPAAPDIVLLKIPANHSYLRYILRQLATSVNAETIILASAKAKDITRNVLAVFQQELGQATASLTVKKCRLVTVNSLNTTPSTDKEVFPLCWPLENTPFTIVNHANVFAREKLDLGARFLLEHLPAISAGDRVIDLGCGNGVLALLLLQQQPDATLLLCDESWMAIASAQETIARNLPQHLAQCRFITDDSLSQQPATSADVIICNPPFHQQQAVTTHIASQMFQDAKRVLSQGGRLRIVANRHLNYAEQLKRLFGNCRLVAGNPKFVILEAVKRS
ncbi:methyltransferase [Chromatiaceae bacterium AAb-1]|nr:methyltransferase [Chromatiaceae bacterium AAb-1]